MLISDNCFEVDKYPKIRIIFVHTIILFFIAALGIVAPLNYLRYGIIVQVGSVFLLILLFWSVISWNLLKQDFFNPYMIFFIAAVLFNGGQAILELFHLNKNGILGGKFTDGTIAKTIYFVVLSLSLLHLGALIGLMSATKTVAKNKIKRLVNSQNASRVGWFLFYISLVPAIYIFKNSVSTVHQYGYIGLYQQEDAIGINAIPKILADFLVPSALFLLAGSKERRSNLIISATVIIAYAFLQFYIGARSKAIMPLIAYAWLWNQIVRPIPKIPLWGAALSMIVVISPLISVIRDGDGANRFSTEKLMNAISSTDNLAVMAVSEMGGSMMATAYTIDLVPSYRDFDLGADYFYSMLTIMPNLFWDIHPTIARGLPSYWLTWTVDPYTASRGGGLGFSFIAEAYLNFGWWGSVFLGFLGFLFVRFINWSVKSNDLIRMAMLASFTSFFLFYVRQEAASQFRALLWYSFMPYLLAHLITLRVQNRSSCNNNK